MKLNYITFVFENCDKITIDGKYIGDFLVDDIETYFKRIACNSISKIEVTNTFAIEIHKDANKERYQFDQICCEDWKQLIFDRFQNGDITHVDFELEEQYLDEDNTPKKHEHSYSVVWGGDNVFYNEAQKTYISKVGHLYIVISKDKNVEDLFDKEWIDDKDSMDFHFEMCDIGDANQRL